MRKILLSLLTVSAVAIVAVVATGAFFSDTETSTGNTFTAGAIDLKIDNESWYFGEGEVLELRPDLSWDLDDLTGHLFFNYDDLKPGDWGEDTISIHVYDNDAWACADLYVTKNDDMSSVDPELEAGDQQEDPVNIWDGELAQNIRFVFWWDDGDNVYENDEEILLSESTAYEAISGLHLVLADSTGAGIPLTASQTYHIGKFWCYGAMSPTPLLQDDDSGPDVRGSGFTCNGSGVTNWSQTDNMMLDLSFYAEQERHNGSFVCQPFSSPTGMTVLDLENKDNGWSVIDDDTYGTMVYSASPTFYGTVVAQGLEPNAKYQITLNSQPNTGCGFTATSLGEFGSNAFESGFWSSAYPNLNTVCLDDDEGVYNMNLIDDHYTVITDSFGKFNYAFNLTLPSGTYTDVKVLVKKMLDAHESPWVDTTTEHTTNLFETAPITFTVD